MAILLTNTDDLTRVADAIRAKTGSTSPLQYPDGMAEAIIGVGSDCNATSSDILSGKTAFAGNSKVTGSIPLKSAATYNTSTSDQTIASGQYLSGDQTIKAVTTSNIDAGNIKQGVTVTVGDANNATRIKNVTGTFTGDGTAAAGDMLSGKIGYVNGNKVTGTIESKAAATYNTSATDQTISAVQYLSGAQTIKAVTTSNISAANIKNGVNIKVGDANDSGRIIDVTGTFASDATIAAGDVLSGKIGYNGANKITGNIPSKAAATYNTSTSDQTISTGQYISGTQTIKAVTTSNISAGNIKTGVVVKVGDANSATRIANVTGTFTSDGTAAAGHILSGKIGYVNGNKITGTIASLGATTYNASTSDQTIAAGKYLSGTQTIRKITTSNISAGNIKKGITIQVGDSGSATRIANVAGSCVECGLPGNLDVFPIMWNSGTNWSSWAYHSDTTSSYAAERTVGLKGNVGLVTSSIRSFSVPTRMTWTYYSVWHTNTTSTITFEPGRWYYLRGKDTSDSTNYCIYSDYDGTNKLTDFYKLVSWVYA